MPDLGEYLRILLNPTHGRVCKLVSASMTVCIVTVIACLANSYHKINEGHVGVYFKYGALQDRVNDPGVHFLLPFVEDYREVKIRPETFSVDPVVAITKDGIENTFEEMTTITMVGKENVISMVRTFGMKFKHTLVYDRIKEELRIFCANHTIDEVYNTIFLHIVDNVKDKVMSSIKRLGQEGVEILNLDIPKPKIPKDIGQKYKQVKIQFNEQLVATQQQNTERIKKETEQIKAKADAERLKAVLEITNQKNIIDAEGKKNVSLINNDIKKATENNEADIAKYKLEKEAEGNNALFTDRYIKLNLAKSLSNNTKFYFSGQQSELGSLLSNILGN